MVKNYNITNRLSYCDDISFDRLIDSQYSDIAKSFFQDISGKDHKLDDVLNHDKSYSWDDYSNHIIQKALPWIILFGVVFLLWVIILLYLCFRCACCKRKMKHTSVSMQFFCFIIAISLAISSIVCACFVIYFSDVEFQSLQQMQCSTSSIPNDMLYGSYKSDWVGTEQGLEILGNVSSALQNYGKITEEVWADSDYLDTLVEDSTVYVSDYYNENKEVQVLNPQTSGSSLKPLYIQELGPYTTNTTYTGIILVDLLENVFPLVEALKYIKPFTLGYDNQVATYNKELNVSITDLEEYQDGIKTFRNRIDDWVVDHEDDIKNSWRAFTLLSMFYGLLLSIVIIFIFYTVCISIRKKSKALFTWSSVILGLFSLLGFLLVVVLVGTGVVVSDSCHFVKKFGDSKQIKETSGLIPSDVIDQINICLNQNGDIARSDLFGDLYASLIFLQDIQTAFQNFTNIAEQYKQRLYNLQSLDKNQQVVSFIQIDQATTTYLNVFNAENYSDQAFVALQNLNQWSDHSIANTQQSECTKYTEDKWVVLKSNCQKYTYISSQSPTQNQGQKSCLVIREWNTGQITQRYDGYLVCGTTDVYGNIQTHHENFVNYMNDLDLKYTAVNSSLGILKSELYENNNKVINTTNLVLSYNDQFIQPLLLKTIDLNQGILYNLNCSFAGVYYRYSKKSLCDNSLPGLLFVFWFLFALSGMSFLLMLFSFYLGNRKRLAIAKKDD